MIQRVPLTAQTIQEYRRERDRQKIKSMYRNGRLKNLFTRNLMK